MTNLNNLVNSFVASFCSPTAVERGIASDEYQLLHELLAGPKFQSGSFARFTAISPLNDLDVIWVLSESIEKRIEEGPITMGGILDEVAGHLSAEYRRKGRKVKVSPQMHSVMVEFLDRDGDEFTVDIVPAHELAETNEFGDHLYTVPEVGTMNKAQRRVFYESLRAGADECWIKTDPRGYIELAKRSNGRSRSFRKATKLLKKWKCSWKGKNNFGETEFKLKSFHIELAVLEIIDRSPGISALEASEVFWTNIDKYLEKPRFLDRAQEVEGDKRFIDSYVLDLDEEQKSMICIASRSALLLVQGLREAKEENEIVDRLHRLVSGEEFIEAYGFIRDCPAIRDNRNQFSIDGDVLSKSGFRSGRLSRMFSPQKALSGKGNQRKINFRIKSQPIGEFESFWKVRNTGEMALKEDSLRGEISKGGTLRDPERTEFDGVHQVTCYLVDPKRGVVVGEDEVNVPIRTNSR